MAYTIVDIIEKLIRIEQKAHMIYKNFAFAESFHPGVKNIANVFAREEERHVVYYTELKKQLESQKAMEMGFEIYDQASEIITGFLKQMVKPEVATAKEFLLYALDFEKKNVALLKRISDSVSKEQDESKVSTQKAIEIIISEEEKHVRNLEVFVKNES